MKKLLGVAALALLLAACAAPQNDAQATADAQAHAACRNVDPPIGSHMVRRADCGVTSPDTSEQARRDAQTLQQQQIQRQTGSGYGKF